MIGLTHSPSLHHQPSIKILSFWLDPAPEKYWKLVAEERRKALEETLEENLKVSMTKHGCTNTVIYK